MGFVLTTPTWKRRDRVGPPIGVKLSYLSFVDLDLDFDLDFDLDVNLDLDMDYSTGHERSQG